MYVFAKYASEPRPYLHHERPADRPGDPVEILTEGDDWPTFHHEILNIQGFTEEQHRARNCLHCWTAYDAAHPGEPIGGCMFPIYPR